LRSSAYDRAIGQANQERYDTMATNNEPDPSLDNHPLASSATKPGQMVRRPRKRLRRSWLAMMLPPIRHSDMNQTVSMWFEPPKQGKT